MSGSITSGAEIPNDTNDLAILAVVALLSPLS